MQQKDALAPQRITRIVSLRSFYEEAPGLTEPVLVASRDALLGTFIPVTWIGEASASVAHKTEESHGTR